MFFIVLLLQNFANTFMEKGFTPAHEEATASLATSLHTQMVEDIAHDRGIESAAVQALMNEAPLLPVSAKCVVHSAIAFQSNLIRFLAGKGA